MAESIHETNSQRLTQETSQQRLIRREKLELTILEILKI